MMEILYQQNPSIFLFGLPSLYGVTKTVSGFGAADSRRICGLVPPDRRCYVPSSRCGLKSLIELNLP